MTRKLFWYPDKAFITQWTPTKCIQSSNYCLWYLAMYMWTLVFIWSQVITDKESHSVCTNSSNRRVAVCLLVVFGLSMKPGYSILFNVFGQTMVLTFWITSNNRQDLVNCIWLIVWYFIGPVECSSICQVYFTCNLSFTTHQWIVHST